MSFGNRLKEARQNLGLKQEQLAEMVGVGNSTICNYEKGISFPNVDFLYKLFDVLDVDPNFLFQDEVPINDINLDPDERRIVLKYRRLSPAGKEKVETYIVDLLANPKNNNNNNEPPTFHVAARGNSHLEIKPKGTLQEIMEEIKDD